MSTPNSKVQKEPLPSQGKFSYEFLWRMILFTVSMIASFLLKKVYLYQTSQLMASIKKGNFSELILFGLPAGIIFILCDHLSHYLLDKKCAEHFVNDIKYTTQEQRMKKAYSIVRWAYSALYYALSSIAALLIILPTSFMPTWLGGKGYCTDITRYCTKLEEANTAMKVLYIIQFGKQLGRFFQHCFIRPEGNFNQFALHHGLSTFLIFFSFLTNQWIIGIFVMLIHDISDFFLILGRAYRQYKYVNKVVQNFIYVIAVATWIFCRIFLLSFCCVYSSFLALYNIVAGVVKIEPELYEIMVPCVFFMGLMLFLLEIMQVFWTYHIVSSFISVSISDKIARHSYD